VHGSNGLRGYDWMNPTVERIMVDECPGVDPGVAIGSEWKRLGAGAEAP